MKYLTKSISLKQQNPNLAEQVGLLKGQSLHKFFRLLFTYPNNEKTLSGKIQKPIKNSLNFINEHEIYELELSQLNKYLKLNPKTGKIKIVKPKKKPNQAINNLTTLIEQSINHSTQSRLIENSY
jgi:hypothetical protein